MSGNEVLAEQLPFGVWQLLSTLDEYMASAAMYEEPDHQVVTKLLTRLEVDELPVMEKAVMVVITVSDSLYEELKHYASRELAFAPPTSNGRSFKKWLRETLARQPDPTQAESSYPEPHDDDFVATFWAIRQGLSLVERLVNTMGFSEPMAAEMVEARFRLYTRQELRWIAQTFEVIIMAAALVLDEVYELMERAEQEGWQRRRRLHLSEGE